MFAMKTLLRGEWPIKGVVISAIKSSLAVFDADPLKIKALKIS